MHLNKAIDMADSQGLACETANLTENLLPVELSIHDHYGRETLIVLHKLPATIGRNEFADVPLIDPWISHRHCEIDQIGNVLVVRDLHSKNGIFMHGHRVRESHVLSGEQLTVGQTEITVRYRSNSENTLETTVIGAGRTVVVKSSNDAKTTIPTSPSTAISLRPTFALARRGFAEDHPLR
jgi:pSer/pThr/pTyr-binding forkhead associated (FHA) protein